MAEVFPVIPSGIPAQTAADIGRAPDFCFDETGRSGAFHLVDGAVQEVSGAAAVRRWLELMLRQKPGAVPIYRTDGETQPGVEAASLDRRAPEGGRLPRSSRISAIRRRSARQSARWTASALRGCGTAWRCGLRRISTRTKLWR